MRAQTLQGDKIALEGRDLPCVYLAHHELESFVIIMLLLSLYYLRGKSVTTTDRDRCRSTSKHQAAKFQWALKPARPYLVHLIPCGCPKAVGGQGGLRGNALWTHTALMLEQACAKICTAGLLEAVSKTDVALRCIAPCRQSLHNGTAWMLHVAT